MCERNLQQRAIREQRHHLCTGSRQLIERFLRRSRNLRQRNLDWLLRLFLLRRSRASAGLAGAAAGATAAATMGNTAPSLIHRAISSILSFASGSPPFGISFLSPAGNVIRLYSSLSSGLPGGDESLRFVPFLFHARPPYARAAWPQLSSRRGTSRSSPARSATPASQNPPSPPATAFARRRPDKTKVRQ